MTLSSLIVRHLKRRPNFGDLAGTKPISDYYGYDRGTPIDRYYIESFLRNNADAVRGRTLEVGDDTYTATFGGLRAHRRDVLHVHADNPAATFVGDLATPGTLPRDTFDCAIVTQTLHLIYEVKAALAQLHDCLRPGGVLLATTPGVTQIARDEWGTNWYWSFTLASIRRLVAETFPTGQASFGCHGNVFAATAFLQGVALEEVPRAKLDVYDEAYPLIITIRATKRDTGARVSGIPGAAS
jgi:SAM-dependent methyltransferase